MSDEDVKTFPMILAGREIMFKRPALGQILMLQRIAMRNMNRAKQTGDEQERLRATTEAVVKTLDFIDTLIINEEDRQFVEDGMLAGTIEYDEVMAALSGGQKEDPIEDDATPMPKILAKKKPATVVSRARAKR